MTNQRTYVIINQGNDDGRNQLWKRIRLFYSIQYHIVWCVKYRRRVLLGEVEKDLKKSMIEIAGNYGVTIVEMETDQDHIHLLVECTPQHYIPDILKT